MIRWFALALAMLGCAACAPSSEQAIRPDDALLTQEQLARAAAAGDNLLKGAVNKEACDGAVQAAKQLEDASRGQVRLDQAGVVMVSAEVWSQVPAVQRRSLLLLAAIVARCAQGDGAEATVIVRDPSSGRELYRGAGPSGSVF